MVHLMTAFCCAKLVTGNHGRCMTKMKLETKLRGKWKSDRRRTLEIFAPYHNPKNKKRKRFISSMFGKLELHITKKFIHSKMNQFREKKPYEIIDSTEHSLVLLYQETMMAELLDEEPTTEFIITTFEETRYHEYLYLTHSSFRFSECFRRVTETKKTESR